MPGSSTGAATSSSSTARRDVGKLADGTAFAPQFLENKLKFSPYIGEAVVFGDATGRSSRRSSRSTPRRSAIGPNGSNLAYTSFQDLSARAEVRDLIRDEIRKCNAALPAPIRLRRFLVLNKEFDADDDEITRTRKIRRRFVAEKYAAVVDAFYRGAAEVEVSAEITYEDGRKTMLRSTLAIGDVEEPVRTAEAMPRRRHALRCRPSEGPATERRDA